MKKSKYHMHRKEKEIKTRERIKSILKNGKFTTLALCRQNEPYVITMNYGYDSKKNCLYFHCAQKGLKLQFIQENSQVCGTIIEDKDYLMNQCDHAYRSVVFWGRITIIKELKEKKYAMDILIDHLEKNPSEIKKRMLKEESSYNSIKILRVEIDSITGKEGPIET